MAQNLNHRWRPSALLVPWSLINGPHLPVKFYANPTRSFEDMTICFFADLAWNAYSVFTPQKFCFWGSEPLNVIGHHRHPKRHIRGWNRAYMEIGQVLRPVREPKKPKKGKKRNLQWQTRRTPRPPTLIQRHVVLHAEWSSGDSSKFQVSSKSV